MRFSRLQRLILRDLFESEKGLHVFTIHRRYNIAPVQLVDSLRTLVDAGLIEIADDRMKLTEKGNKEVLESRIELLSHGEKAWRECPPDFKQPSIAVNQPYIPKISLLDAEAFPFKKKRQREDQ